MANEDNGQKIYPPTQEKRDNARKNGQVAKSSDLVGLLVLFFGLIMIYLAKENLPHLMDELLSLLYRGMSAEVQNVYMYKSVLSICIKYCLPFLLVLMIAAFLGNYIQVGLKFSAKAIKADLNKISLLKGAKKMFSFSSIIELVKSFLKILGVFFITYKELETIVIQMPNMFNTDIFVNYNLLFDSLFSLGLKAIILLLGISILDFAYKKFKFEKDLKMTRQEMKDEMKKSEGNPLVKQKQKEMARALSQKQIARVKEATVLIVNPTHFAVALKYEEGTYSAPIVVFKGVDEIALNAKKIARESNVPIVENKPLARALYANVKEDESIPFEMFEAVSVILAQIYSLNN